MAKKETGSKKSTKENEKKKENHEKGKWTGALC